MRQKKVKYFSKSSIASKRKSWNLVSYCESLESVPITTVSYGPIMYTHLLCSWHGQIHKLMVRACFLAKVTVALILPLSFPTCTISDRLLMFLQFSFLSCRMGIILS